MLFYLTVKRIRYKRTDSCAFYFAIMAENRTSDESPTSHGFSRLNVLSSFSHIHKPSMPHLHWIAHGMAQHLRESKHEKSSMRQESLNTAHILHQSCAETRHKITTPMVLLCTLTPAVAILTLTSWKEYQDRRTVMQMCHHQASAYRSYTAFKIIFPFTPKTWC